jgi:FemAB-related protein (PEP-CTERM system-associated)
MEIRTAQSEDRGAWDAYVRRHPEASPYHLFAWKLAVEATYGHRAEYLMAEREGAICGVLPLFRFRAPLVTRRVVSLPFCDLGGVLADDAGIERALIDAAARSCRRWRASGLTLRNARAASCESELAPRRLAGNKVRMLLDLPDSAEALMKSFPSKLRSQVRKASKNGLAFAWGDGTRVDDFYRIFGRNMRDLGSPVHARRLFHEVLRHFGADARVGLIQLDGLAVAGGFLLSVGPKVCVPWASSLREYNHLSPNMLLYWSLLEHASNGPYTLFDFGRSSLDEGTYRFKKQWGARPVPLHWIELSCRPGGSGPARDVAEDGAGGPGRARRWAERVWQHLPVPVANLVGPRLRKYISL